MSSVITIVRNGLAAIFFLASAGFKIHAARQRWTLPRVIPERVLKPEPIVKYPFTEDHVFDYSFPVDPWQNIGSAAQMFGVRSILFAAGFALLVFPIVGRSYRWTAAMLTTVVVVSFVLVGIHALISGIEGEPSMFEGLAAGFAGAAHLALVPLTVLFILQVRRWGAGPSRCWGLAMVLVWSNITVGVLGNGAIAVAITGHSPFDSAMWTEAVAGTLAALIGVLVLAGAVWFAVSERRDSRLSRDVAHLDAASSGMVSA